MLEVGFAAGRRLDIENLAGLVESYAGRGQRAATFLLSFVLARGLSLFVGFGESAAKDPGSGDDDLGDDAMSLEQGER